MGIADSQRADAARLLISKGGDPNLKNAEGTCPGDPIVSIYSYSTLEVHHSPKDHLRIIRLLLARGVDPNAKTTRTGDTPLHSLWNTGGRWNEDLKAILHKHRAAASKGPIRKRATTQSASSRDRRSSPPTTQKLRQ